MHQLTKSTAAGLRRVTLLTLGPLLAAGLLAAVPTAAQAAGDPLSPEETESVPVKAAAKAAAAEEQAETETVPLPEPEWPEPGEITEIEIADEFTSSEEEVDARSEDPAAAPDVVTIEALGKLPTNNSFGPGASYSITPAAQAPDPEPEPEPTDPAATDPAPTEPTPTAPTETPDGEGFEGVLFRQSGLLTQPVPEPSPEVTEPPFEDETDEGETEQDEPVLPEEPYTAPIELQVSYADFAGAYGGNWGSRLRAVLVQGCETPEGESPAPEAECEPTTTPLESTNNTEKQTVSAIIPAAAYAAAGSATLAVTADEDSDQGDYGASPLAASSEWSSGTQSGDFTWSYPLAMPPAGSGPAPNLAVNYSSGSVDGRTSSTNGQTSALGEGFEMNPGFVERSYNSCTEEVLAGRWGNVPRDADGNSESDDLCWTDDNLTISLNGKSNQIIRDKLQPSIWRMKSDDGTKIERKSDTNNADNDGEYWIATTPDGTKYYFGKNKRWSGDPRQTFSVSAVPVFSNQSNEPCYDASSFNNSFCDEGWRWGLDYVVDPHGNSMSLYYEQERNYYDIGKNGGNPVHYEAAANLSRIEYGTRAGTNDPTPPIKVDFDWVERCIPDANFSCASSGFNEDHAYNWPDVPFDQVCSEDSPACAGRTSPTFFSHRRLAGVTTQIFDYTSEAYSNVNTWEFGQSFPQTGDGTDRALFLRYIKQTARKGTSEEEELPAVMFSGEEMINRVDAVGDDMAPFAKFRVRGIRNGAGGLTTINYSNRECSPSTVPASTKDQNHQLCFPAAVSRDFARGRQYEFFHKYVVDSVVETDLTGKSPSVPTRYTYVGEPAWRKEVSNLTPARYRTWSDWRGYGKVITQVGGESPTWNETLYMRGMDNNPQDTGDPQNEVIEDTIGQSPNEVELSPNIEDKNAYNGFVRRTRTLTPTTNAAGVTVNAYEVAYNDPVYTETADPGPGNGEIAYIVNTAVTQTTTPIHGGNRVTRTESTFDDHGRATQVRDRGDLDSADDDRCTNTSYAPAGAFDRLDLVKQSVTTAAACGATISSADQVISATKNRYDNATSDTYTPTRGLLTETFSVSQLDGSTVNINHLDATNTYDDRGRIIKTIDAAETPTITAYTDTVTEGVPTQITTTVAPAAANEQVTTTTLNRRWGTPGVTTAPGGQKTEREYDSLGRVINIWVPGRERANSVPSYKFSYSLSSTEPNIVTTQTLGTGSEYTTSKAFYDGLLRPRLTQAPAANPEGGRMITEQVYDSHGRVESVRGPYYNFAEPNNTFVLAAPAGLPTYTDTTYDRASRPTVTSLMSLGKKKWDTTTTYGGDRVSVTPPAGGTATTTVTDARGQTTSLLQYQGATATGAADTTTYTYTGRGQLETVKTPAETVGAQSPTWSYEYDIRGRQKKSVDPDKGVTTTAYDVLDRPQLTEDANSKKLWTTYDNLGRKVELRDNDATGRVRASWTYFPDGASGEGQVESAKRFEAFGPATGEYSTDYTYDAVGRPSSVTMRFPNTVGANLFKSDGYKTTMGYYPNGLLKTVEQPSTEGTGVTDENLTYSYDRLGNLSSLTGGGAIVAGTSYTPDGLVAQRVLGPTVGKAIYDTRDYDDSTRRLTRQAVNLQGAGVATQLDLRYGYDPSGNVTSLDDKASIDPASFNQCFDYDYLRRMTEAWTTTTTDCAEPSGASPNLGTQDPYWDRYEYNKSGNRTKWTEVDGTGTGAVTTIHQSSYPVPSAAQPHALTAVDSGSAGTETFGYDAVGNTTDRSGATPGGEQEIAWDAEGHQTSVKNTTDDELTEYVYDADGGRILKKAPTDDGSATTTLYVGNSEYTDTAGALSLVRNYSVDDEPVATRTSQDLTLVVADRNKSGQLSINGTTLAPTKRRFTPFGEDLKVADAWPNQHGYLNKTKDISTGTTHLGAREYDPKLGRFLSVDPVGDIADPQQLNGYAYANNAPITSSDPSGLFAEDPNCSSCTASRLEAQGEARDKGLPSGSRGGSPLPTLRPGLGNGTNNMGPEKKASRFVNFVAGVGRAATGAMEESIGGAVFEGIADQRLSEKYEEVVEGEGVELDSEGFTWGRRSGEVCLVVCTLGVGASGSLLRGGAKGVTAGERLFVSKTAGVDSKLLGHSRTGGAPGLLNRPGSRLKFGWTSSGQFGGGYHLRIGVGRRLLRPSQAWRHIDRPFKFSHVPNAIANAIVESIRAGKGLQ